jgi:heme/copper-type cytochrome/quinol oxidase subunit 3
MRRPEFDRDLSNLPDYAFGARGLMWWGMLSFMLIEGAGFALALAAYFFLMGQEQQWPPSTIPPDLMWGLATILLLALSEIPNVWVKHMARQQRLREVRIGLIIMTTFGAAIVACRFAEFAGLNIGWTHNAYGSIVWALLLLHTVHLLTDLADSIFLVALVITPHGREPRTLVDVDYNSLYWHFIVWSWLPIYFVVYWLPRLS